MDGEQKTLGKKNEELAQKFREKSKNHQKLQQLYTSLKQQHMASGLEVAADHDAEHALQAAAGGEYNMSNHRNGPQMQSRAGSYGSGGSGGRRQNVNAWETQGHGSRPGFQTSCKGGCLSFR